MEQTPNSQTPSSAEVRLEMEVFHLGLLPCRLVSCGRNLQDREVFVKDGKQGYSCTVGE